MYISFSISNYRGFRSLTLEPLGHVNLITGKNNVGKTALLEAIWLHHGYYNPSLGLAVDNFRGLTQVRNDEFFLSLFFDFDANKPIELSSQDSNSNRGTLYISREEPSISTVPLRSLRGEKNNGHGLSDSEGIVHESTEPVGAEVKFRYETPLSKYESARIFIDQDELKIERSQDMKGSQAVFLAARQRGSSKELAERFSNLAILKNENKLVRFLTKLSHASKG